MRVGAIFLLLWTGCDFSTPAVEDPSYPMDPALIGRWIRTDQHGRDEELLVLPWDTTTCLIQYPANSPDAMVAKACNWLRGTTRWIQLEWIGTVRGTIPGSSKIYQFATCETDGGKMTIRLLNPDVFQTPMASPGAWKTALDRHRAHPDRLRTPWVFRKVSAPATSPSQ